MADTWRYRFYAMQNGLPGFTQETHLFDLPLNQVSFSTVLQQVGQFSGTVQLADPSVQAALLGQPPLHLLCDRTAIYVELNGELVWGGLLQQVSYDSLAQTCQLQGMDWWGYFSKARLISWNASYVTADQLYIAADLVNCAQGAPYSSSASGGYEVPGYTPSFTGVVGGDVGVQLGALALAALGGTYSSDIALTQSWAQGAFKNLGQAISDIGTGADGFDWTIDVAYVDGAPTKTFNVWYPRAGRSWQIQSASGAAVVFNLSGQAGQKYVWAAGQTQTANTAYGSGSGSANSALVAEAQNPALLQEGWPLLENSISYTDVGSQSLLDDVTLAYLNQVMYPISQPQIIYNAGSDSDQPLGAYALGDDCRVIIAPDPYFPSGYDSAGSGDGEQWWRVQQVTTTVNDQGKSYQTIVLGAPPVLAGQ